MSSFCLPKTSSRSLYYSLVYPYLIYCVSVWGLTYQGNLSRIIILQQKIIRIISKVSFLFSYRCSKKFSDIYLYQKGKVMYLFKRGLHLNYLRDMFTLGSEIHSYIIIQEIPALFIYLIVELIFQKFSIRFQGPKFFNSLRPGSDAGLFMSRTQFKLRQRQIIQT